MSTTVLETLPEIPAKRYFTIGEVSDLCGVKTHVLRYWEQEFSELRPVKRRGNRRYYQRQDVLLVRQIRELLYGQGYTTQGARLKLQAGMMGVGSGAGTSAPSGEASPSLGRQTPETVWRLAVADMIDELEEIAQMLN